MLLEEVNSIEDLGKRITSVLNNIDKHALFIRGETQHREILNKVNIIVNANSPPIFVIAGFGVASQIVKECLEKIKTIFKEYEFESISSGNKEILFFERKMVR